MSLGFFSSFTLMLTLLLQDGYVLLEENLCLLWLVHAYKELTEIVARGARFWMLRTKMLHTDL